MQKAKCCDEKDIIKETFSVFALRDICTGDEIRYDYGPDDGRMHWRYVLNKPVQLKKYNKTLTDANAVTAFHEHGAVAYVLCDKVELTVATDTVAALVEREATLVTDAAPFVKPPCVDRAEVAYVPCDKAELTVATDTVAALVEREATLGVGLGQVSLMQLNSSTTNSIVWCMNLGRLL